MWQILLDLHEGVRWDTSVPRAPPIPSGEPPKIIPIYGPSRFPDELDLPWQYGTNWGMQDPRNGIAWKDLNPEERYGCPPPYSED